MVNVTEKSLTDFKPSGEVALCLCNASAMSKSLLKLLAPGGAFVAYSDTGESLPSIHSVDVPVTAAIFKGKDGTVHLPVHRYTLYNGMKLPSTNGTYTYAMEESENTECTREKNGREEVGKIRSRALKDQ